MPRYAITTFGCQMNVHDSERMHEVLRGAGYVETEENAEADVILLNTCSVREKAEQKLLSEVGRLAKLKRAKPDLVLVVAGCVAQQEGEKLLARSSAIDLVVGPDQIPEIPGLLGEVSTGGLPVVRTVFDADAPRFLTALSVVEGSATAFVTTMKGCDERCSFCIVPTTRGPERYRSSASIVSEIAALTERGVREVTLLGQTVNSYRDPDDALPKDDGAGPEESQFAALLRRIAERAPGLVRLRYTSPHPRHFGPALIRAHKEIEILARHVHLPVQSGSDRILKRMIRRTTRASYLERVAILRREVPGVTLSTDIIVGFPGETEADFAETLSLVEEAGFLGVFGFKYSQRPGTPALRLEDDVSEAEKSARLSRLFEVSERLIASHLATLVGSRQRVLIEGVRRNDKNGAQGELRASGRTERNEIVHIHDPAAIGLTGEVVDVTIEKAFKHSLLGVLDSATASRGRERAGALPKTKRTLPLLSEGA